MKLLIPFLLLYNSLVQAQPLERGNINSCAYQAGTAYEIQLIRQQEAHAWDEFAANINRISNDSQGREDLLAIAERFFIHPGNTAADVIHDEILQSCVARQHGTEPLT